MGIDPPACEGQGRGVSCHTGPPARPPRAGRPGQTVSHTHAHTHTLQTEPTDRAADQTQPVNEGHVGVWVTLRAALTLLAFDHVG